MPMKLIETTVSKTTVYMQFADHAEPEKATEWLEFEVPLVGLMRPDGKTPLGEPLSKRFVVIQVAALDHVRDAIDQEIRRLSDLASGTA